MAPFLARTGERQRLLGEGVRLLRSAGLQLRLAQGEVTARLLDAHIQDTGLLDRPREQRHGLGDAPREGVGRPQSLREIGEIDRQVHLLTEAHGAFEQREGPVEVALDERHDPAPPRGLHQARGGADGLGNPEPVVPDGTALWERA